jgi:glycine cleavage system regulatory protein
MNKSLVITLIGNDRPGIVESVSAIVLKHQGEWVESRMANLSGKFAGILHTLIPESEYQGFCTELESGVKGVKVYIESADTAAPEVMQTCYKLQLVGQDRPGIVHRITAALSAYGATVDDMESEIYEASMSGETLFAANITLCLPQDGDIDGLGKVLEDLANELIVDIELG